MIGQHAVRPYRADDLAPLAELMRRTLDLSALTPELIVRDFLLAPHFSADHLLVAVAGNVLAGFLLAPRRHAAGPANIAWLAAFGVLPTHRGHGVATALIATAVHDMRNDGITRVDVADVPVSYLLPGVDRVAFPQAYLLLTEKFSFSVRDEVASMGIRLAELADVVPDATVHACPPGAYPLLREFLCREFDAGWWEFFHRSIATRLGGQSGHSDVICAWEHGVPVGAVHYRDDRFGPLAVSARLRGRGIGAQLTRAALAGMRSSGFAEAYFMSGRVEVQPFYRRLGFRILRRFTRLTRAL